MNGELAKLFQVLDRLGSDARASGVRVDPQFAAERGAAAAGASVTGLGAHDLRLGTLVRATAEGVMRGLAEALPEALRRERTELVGTGNALRRLAVMRAAAETVFGMPLALLPFREAAAAGAAMLAARLAEPG